MRIKYAVERRHDSTSVPGTYKQCVDVSPLGILSGPEDRPVHLLARAFAESQQNPDTIADTVFDGTGLRVAEARTPDSETMTCRW